MSKVNLLDSNTINKIAAGEVVERPASCVKELVENAIDAGATRIEIEIQSGGKSFIRVTDNGVGMNREDASLSVRSHATSKIKNANDLPHVETLGFRGEALPTITSVSKFTMRTRNEDSELGTLVNIEGGKNQDIQEVGCPLGTTIQVEDLFFNTPVRKKFLKTSNTEGTKIHDYIVKVALSRPSIVFKFINGNRNAINTPGNGNLLDTISSIYGHEIADSLLAIDFKDKMDENFTIKGYISKPNVLKSYRTWQTFIVNGRIINNRIISKAVDEAYKSMIPKVGFPLAILIIDVPPLSVDVNVHPQKIEVRFEDESKIYRSVYGAISQAINEKAFVDLNVDDELQNVAVTPDKLSYHSNVSRDDLANDPFRPLKRPVRDTPHYSSHSSKGDDKAISNMLKSIARENHITDELGINKKPPADISTEDVKRKLSSEVELSLLSEETPFTGDKVSNRKIRPISQVDLCYIIAQSEDELYLIDQHAAHERILFDRLLGYTNGIPAQQLLVHQILNFDDYEAKLIEDHQELFRKLGFTMELSGKNEYRLMEIPIDVQSMDSEGILREILSSLPPVDEGSLDGDDHHQTVAKNIRQACLATTACRAAIKSGQELNLQQMQMLIDQLSQTTHPFTCPHGRPTIIKFSSHDLAKMFKRTGF